MDPSIVRAVQRAAIAFLVTFVVGSGVVYAIDRAGDDGDVATPTPTSPGPGEPDGGGGSPATTPSAYLVWMPGGFPGGSEGPVAELATIPRVRRVTVAFAGVGWLTRSVDEDGEVVDAPPSPFAVPLEVTGIDPGPFASFLPAGEPRDLIQALSADQVILSASSAKRRGLGAGASLEFDPGGLQLQVAGVLPDALVGGYEAVVVRATAERLGAGLPRYALMKMRKGATPNAARVTEDVTALMQRVERDPAVEVRVPGDTELLRAHDRSPTPSSLKRRFGEFVAYPSSSTALTIGEEWQEDSLDTREVPRLGTLTCHRKTLSVLRRAMAEVAVDADLGDVGACFDETWRPDMPQGTLPAGLWGASIRLSVSLNRPGAPPLLDARIVETMAAWGFRWAGDDAYPDGSLFEFAEPPPREGDDEATPSPTD